MHRSHRPHFIDQRVEPDLKGTNEGLRDVFEPPAIALPLMIADSDDVSVFGSPFAKASDQIAQSMFGVTFPVSQRDLIAVREKIGENAKLNDHTVYVEIGKGKRYQYPGKVDFLDVGVNTGTDSVNVRATFPNPQGLLVDGQLVTAVVEAQSAEPTLVTPVNAIQIDQSGSFVLVVNSEKKIEVRRVELLRQDAGFVAIAKGLSAGDLVVTEGVQKVKPGQVVDATEVKPEA